ncbi:hypothetical protein ACKFKG_26210 [Phormidesmis sp. 146-35]
MTKQQIVTKLKKALLQGGKMAYAIYEHELEEHIDYWYEGLQTDQDEFVFVVTENSGDVAMLLIMPDKTVYVNEAARNRLKQIWAGEVFESNMKRLIPIMARDLANDIISVTGFKTAY